jgi:hypothetical protein
MHKQLTRDLFKVYATTTVWDYDRIAAKLKISLRTAFYWRKHLGLPARKRGRKCPPQNSKLESRGRK